MLVPSVYKFLELQFPGAPKACPDQQWERFTFYMSSDVLVANGIAALLGALDISKGQASNSGPIGRSAVKRRAPTHTWKGRRHLRVSKTRS